MEYEAALRCDPHYHDALAQLGLWHLVKGHLADAEKLFAQALAIQPADAVVLNNLGIVRFQQKNVSEALRHFCAALAADPTYGPAKDNLRKIEPLLKK